MNRSNAMLPAAYMPQDRRRALDAGLTLPEWAWGTVLFADISGFTRLSEALARTHGLRRGAETLTRLLNHLYEALIASVESHGGSVIGFSGDAITCWFARESPGEDIPSSDAPARAAATAAAMQQTLRAFDASDMPVTDAFAPQFGSLAVKIAIATGRVRRCVVGNPDIQLMDVLAGAVVDRLTSGEEMAAPGETLVDAETFCALAATIDATNSTKGDGSVSEVLWRTKDSVRFAVLESNAADFASASPPLLLPTVEATQWIHPAVAQLIAGGQARFLAELRPATALFVRFAGVNFESDVAAPETLDRYMRWVQQTIQRYDGLLVQLTIGDKGSYFYVAFGAPLAHGDDSARAAAAALDLLRPPPSLAQISPLAMGISSGIMRIGAYGGPTRCTYGVLGDEVNVAARLMTMAAPSEILVTGQVANALGSTMALQPLGARSIKGKSAPVPVFALLERSAQPATALMELYGEPLHGREVELAPMLHALAQWAARCHAIPDSDHRTPAGPLLIIEGTAGIGKSHMAASLVQRTVALGVNHVHAACQSTARAIPFFAIRQVMRAILQLPPEPTEAHVLDAVARLAPAARARAPLLAPLVDSAMAASPLTSHLEARTRQGARTALVLELIAAAADAQPFLLTLEDAHWIDEASREIFVQLLNAPPPPLALVIVQRTSEAGDEPLQSGDMPPGAVSVNLGELSGAATTALVTHRLGGPVDPLAVDVIHAQAHGNPFFVEELVTALVDVGRLMATPHGWQLADQTLAALRAAHCVSDDADAPRLLANAPLDVIDLGVPTSVQGVVLARLDRLPETARLSLKVASVIGRTFALDLLEAVRPLQSRRIEVRSAVEQALARDFVRVDVTTASHSESRAPVYLFKHNIMRDVAYNTLLGEQQRELHLEVAEALEALRPSDIEELAHHYYHSDTRSAAVRKRALDYLARAAARAQNDYANDTALLYYGRAAMLEPRAAFIAGQVVTLHILGRRDEEYALLAQLDAAPDAAAVDCACLWSDYYESVGDYAQAEQALRRGLAASVDNPLAQARCRNRLGSIAWRQADYAIAEAHFSAARQLCQAAADDADVAAEAANTSYGMGLVYRQQGRYDDARAAFAADLAFQRAHGNREREARARTALGHVESIAGHHAAALQAYRDALAIRKAIGDRAGVGASLLAVAQAYGSMGDFAQALPRLEEALHVQQAIRNRFEEWLIWNEMGILHALVGQYDKATRALLAGLEISRAIGSDFGSAYLLCNLGQVQRDDAQPEEGAASLRAALALALEQGDTSLEATCRADLALALLNLSKPADALAEANAAEALAITLGQIDALTGIYAAQARAHLALGQDAAALDAARRGIANLAAHGGDYFPQRDGYWCARVLQACSAHAEAQAAFEDALRTLRERAARISDVEMRASYLKNITVNREIVAAAHAALA